MGKLFISGIVALHTIVSLAAQTKGVTQTTPSPHSGEPARQHGRGRGEVFACLSVSLTIRILAALINTILTSGPMWISRDSRHQWFGDVEQYNMGF